jgi:hypothetical protein
VRWDALGELPACTRLFWQGLDRGLAAALARYPMISSLTWRDAPEEADLSPSWLNHLHFVGQMPQRLRLPSRVRHLSLHTAPGLVVDAIDNGRWLRVHLEGDTAEFPMPQRLTHIRVGVTGNGSLSATPLAELTEVQELTLKWRRASGELTGGPALSMLRKLHHVHFIDWYGVGADLVPEVPLLSYVEIHGITRFCRAVTRPSS